MTQTSYFWDGITTGDAALAAPSGYTEQQFARVFSKILGSDSASGFIVPDYLNELEVSANSPAAANVIVKSGAAFIKGMNYESDAQETLAIAANASGNPRIDRIIIRVDWAAKTIRLAVLQGTAAATPALPSLTQVFGTTWEISIAYVWVANGFVTLAGTEVHDERLFMPSFGMFVNQIAENNLLANSEYIVASSSAKPDLWTTVGTYTAALATKPSQMYRSRAIQVTAGAGSSGFRQITQVRGGEGYVLRGLINVTAGDVGVIEIITNGASPLTVTKYVRRTGAWIDYYMYFTTPSDATSVEVRLLALNATDVVTFGQFLFIPGRIPGAYRPFREYIPLVAAALLLFSVDGKATGTHTLDIPVIDTNNVIDDACPRALMLYINGTFLAGTTVDVSMALQTVGGGVTRQSVGIRNTGSAIDLNRNSEHIMPYMENKTYEVVLAASASPVNYQNFQVLLGGVYT